MSRYIDADKLCEGRVNNDPVVIAAKCEPTADVEPVRHGHWQKVIARNVQTKNGKEDVL